MRICRLDLLRYGKFTDHAISLPQSKRDFHLIIGPNEAGKSTLRSAILDLFFGIETHSSYNFLHPHSEMKLGALIEHEGQSLDFYRIKARKQALFSVSGVALAQDVLNDFLGTTDRTFFDQMFGLNHDKLVAGGNEILHAANDMGQILFQAAAGIGSLGKIRDALEAEADKLWARRKSGEREYYVASDALAEADAELKQATVRTKDWVAAQDSVIEGQALFDQSRQQYRTLETERNRLERMRRVAPTLRALQQKESELAKLGEVIELPTDAARQFAGMELALARANQEFELYQKQRDSIQRQLKQIHLDENLLKYQADIEQLSERRQQLRDHGTNIVKRQQEIKSHWQHIETLAHQLGWTAQDEKWLTNRLPALPVRTAMVTLLKRYDVLQQAQQTSRQAVSDKQKELQTLEEQRAAVPATGLSTALRVTLAAAQGLGDVCTLSKRLEAQLRKAQHELEAAQAGLGLWRLDRETLRHLTLPSAQSIANLKQRLLKGDSAADKLLEKLTELNTNIHNQALEIKQYCTRHHPVTTAELREARQARDVVWSSIKSGVLSLSVAANDFESKIHETDRIADTRYDKAQKASTLQTKQDHLQLMQQQHEDLQAQADANQAALRAVQNEWADTTAKLGLPTIPLVDIEAWLQAREQVLRAADTVREAMLELEALKQVEAEVRSALLDGMSKNEINVEASMSLPTLMVTATDLIESEVKANTRQEALIRQRETGQTALAALQEKAATAQAALDIWKTAWHENLALAGLNVESDVGMVEGALQLFHEMEEKLHRINQLREEHIEAMQVDLSNFEQAATSLMSRVAPDLKQEPAVSGVIELAARLEKTKSEHKEFERLSQDFIANEEKLAAVQIGINHTQLEIQSLLHQAKVTTMDELREAIKRSDHGCNLNAAIAMAKESLLESGDGLTRQQLEAELQSSDVAQIRITLDELARQKEALLLQQTNCSAYLATANAALSAIAGQDAAARAESKRQDALARMANAAERYIKVYTSARLLRWAIDRYRETKQGPMLARASCIFSTLTLDAFQKLVVDFDILPFTLEGLRADGTTVGISGMSDGTRDQLYFALRLAALELHLQQAQPLPFIADDLFINYDDTRAKAGLEVLASLAEKTQIIFLSHHDHLVPVVQAVFGKQINVVNL
ncbi:MAG: AAA family ATPase [Nitrosomonas sp.]|nr:AAA family ATPase [Nitrosomonas sp.]MDP1951728.1 AAA family ATPase [Nitrosomonas sp.]